VTGQALVIARVFPPQVGGSGRFLWEIYRRQPASDVCVAAGQHAGSHAFDVAAPMEVVRLPLHVRNWGLAPAGFVGYLANYLRLRRLVRRRQIASLHAASLLPEGFLAWMLHRTTGLPMLCFIHGEELEIAAASRELSWMAGRVVAAAHTIVANSENTRRLIVGYWPAARDKIVVLTPGVDVERFLPAEPSAAVRARLGWTGRRVVLTAGRLQERKGHANFVRALPEIRQAVPDVLYAIAGDGQERESLEALVDAVGVRGCVKFHGELNDAALIECYQQCELFVLPNRTAGRDIEGFGMVLVEAQACGKPVIAGDSGGAPETVRAPETGLVVDCERPENIVEPVVRLLLNAGLRTSMGAAARQWTLERFDWCTLAARAKGVFASLTTGGGTTVATPQDDDLTTTVANADNNGVLAELR